jgi:hypothetical protein
VAGQVAGLVGAGSHAEVTKQARVAVFTQKARVTQAALEGAPGALTASRVAPLAP